MRYHLSSLTFLITTLHQVVEGTAPKLWKTVKANSPSSLMAALAERPVSVAVAASKDWM